MASRRRFLVGAAATAAAVGAGWRVRRSSGATAPAHLRAIAEAARRAEPGRGADEARAALAADGIDGVDGDSAPAVLASLGGRIGDDFTADRTVVVDGWLLARIEVDVALATA